MKEQPTKFTHTERAVTPQRVISSESLISVPILAPEAKPLIRVPRMRQTSEGEAGKNKWDLVEELNKQRREREEAERKRVKKEAEEYRKEREREREERERKKREKNP